MKNELKNTSWVMYTVQLEDDQSWGGWAKHSTHDTMQQALEELEYLKSHGKNCRVIQVTTEVVA